MSGKNLTKASYVELKAAVKDTLKGSWSSVEKIDLLMDLVQLIQPDVCVEIGAFSGSSILPVAATLRYNNAGIVYAIDAWSNAEAIRNLDDMDPNKGWWSEVDMKEANASFRNLIAQWSLENYCKEIYLPSQAALSCVPDQIDFLHLDGECSEIGALRDVQLYLPKVKRGGFILLSNFYHMIKREQPKVKSFCMLCESCDIVATIENDNAVLFQKSSDENK